MERKGRREGKRKGGCLYGEQGYGRDSILEGADRHAGRAKDERSQKRAKKKIIRAKKPPSICSVEGKK